MTLLGRTSHTGDFHPFQDCDSLCLQRHRNRATRFRPSGLNESAWLELPFHQFPRGWTRRFHKFRRYQFPARLLPCAGGALKRDLHDPFDMPAALLKAHQQTGPRGGPLLPVQAVPQRPAPRRIPLRPLRAAHRPASRRRQAGPEGAEVARSPINRRDWQFGTASPIQDLAQSWVIEAAEMVSDRR